MTGTPIRMASRTDPVPATYYYRTPKSSPKLVSDLHTSVTKYQPLLPPILRLCDPHALHHILRKLKSLHMDLVRSILLRLRQTPIKQIPPTFAVLYEELGVTGLGKCAEEAWLQGCTDEGVEGGCCADGYEDCFGWHGGTSECRLTAR